MTLEIFARDIAPVISLVLTALGLGSILLVWYQIKLGTRWNKLQAQEKFLHRDLEEIERRMADGLEQLGVDYRSAGRELSNDHVETICNDDEWSDLRWTVKRFLNSYEDMAGAVRIGFVDEDFAHALENVRVIRIWDLFKPYILRMREEYEAPELYIELERVANDWRERREKETKEIQKISRANKGIRSPKY